MAIAVVRTAWAGTSGGPGLTQTYVADATGAAITNTMAQAAVNAVRAFWDANKALLPDEISLTVSPTVDIYRENDGELIASTNAATPPASVTGTATVSYAMASGLRANLNTFTILNGRRVRGSIYIVPAATSAFTAAGVVASATRTTVNAAGTTLISALATAGMNLIVFNRPVKDEAGNITRAGDKTICVAIECNEKGAVLRGRRD